MSKSILPRGVLSGANLLHRLQQMADGVAKHGADPGFPNYFATINLTAVHDAVGAALLAAKAAEARVRELAIALAPQSAAVRELYGRGVAAVESFFGLDSPKLREFGLRPRKGPDSAHSKAARSARKSRKKKAAAKASAAATAAPASTPAAPPTGAGH